MKRRISYTLLILCSACLCLPARAQEAGREGEKRPVLPPPSAQKVDPGKIEVSLPPTPMPARNSPCRDSEVERANRSYTAVRDEPEVGNKIRGYPATESLLGGAAGTGYAAGSEPLAKYRVIFDGLLYEVIANDEGVIRRVCTDDPRFKTPEGVAVGDALGKALASSRRKPGKMKAGPYYVELKSGWRALFPPDRVREDGTLAPDARVAAFFKER